MTGAEHYEKAEALLVYADASPSNSARAAAALAAAQVHATLALTQATLVGMESADWDPA